MPVHCQKGSTKEQEGEKLSSAKSSSAKDYSHV
jgi:hypothetical protein